MALLNFFRKEKKAEDIRPINDLETLCRTSDQAMALWEKLSAEHPDRCYRAGLHTGGMYANWYYVKEYRAI